MNQVLDFIVKYKELLLAAFSCILTIVCILVKRKPKTLDDFLYCLNLIGNAIPTLINEVEEPSNGLAKKNRVVQTALVLLRKNLGRELTKRENDWAISYFDGYIEDVLSTPQKKVL